MAESAAIAVAEEIQPVSTEDAPVGTAEGTQPVFPEDAPVGTAEGTQPVSPEDAPVGAAEGSQPEDAAVDAAEGTRTVLRGRPRCRRSERPARVLRKIDERCSFRAASWSAGSCGTACVEPWCASLCERWPHAAASLCRMGGKLSESRKERIKMDSPCS
ncbi:hypothetical protein ACP70R_045880 [Stipagrostis hirtigluma subsp. patula]